MSTNDTGRVPARPGASPAPPGTAVAEPGGARWFAWLYSPPEARAVLEPLLGIEREVEASLRPGLEHAVAHVRVEWWRGEAARFAAGAPAHPLTKALASAGGEAVRAAAELGGLVDATAWDLATATFESRAELDRHCERWARAIAQPLARAATDAPSAAPFARRAGAALRETELLLEAVRDAREGRLRVPLDELDAAGVDPGALARPPWPPALGELVRTRLGALRGTLREAVAGLDPAMQPALRGLLVWCSLADRRTLAALGGPMPPEPPPPARGLRDAWATWRAARRAVRGRLRLA